MTETEKRVPDLRFKGFIEDWEQRTLTTLMDFSNGINAPKENYGKGRKMISVMDILSKEPISYGNIRNSVEVDSKTESNNKVENGDIVFVRSSEVRNEVGWAKAYLENEFALYSGFTIRGKKIFDFDAFFVELSINGKNREQIESKAGGSTRFNVSQSILKSVVISEPSLVEQKKISAFFKQLDDTIALHQRKLTLLEQLKQTYQLGMFPHNGGSIPALRFAGFSEPWEQRKLNDLYEKGGSGGTPQSTNKSYYMGDIPFLGISDISASNGYIYDTEKHISEKGLNNSSAWIVPKEAISLAMYASVGKVAILKTEAATSQAFYNMVFKKISTRNFIFQYLLKIESTNGWNRLISTGTQANLNAQKVRDLEIMIPSLEEQDKIGTFFNRIDHTIDLHQKKISHIQDLKKALLQKMFI